jgi:isoleucyl-tRNA synthetase
MSQLRDELIAANETINWEPDHIKDGRFGEWLREVKDWAFSRERYWGTPLPVWSTDDGERVVVDSVEKLKSLTKPSTNKYFIMRHGESQHNVLNICSSDPEYPHHLTENGKEQVVASAKMLQEKSITAVYCSPFVRSKETAALVCEQLGFPADKIVFDERIREFKFGDFHLKSFDEYLTYRKEHVDDMNLDMPGEGGETLQEAKKRFGDFLSEVESTHTNENILVVTHGIAMEVLPTIIEGMDQETSREFIRSKFKTTPGGAVHEMKVVAIPHNEQYELDLHKPYIDEVELYKDGKKLTRAKEVIDVWFDSGSMPFAQEHYMGSGNISYPGDFISEAIDQTRGWFYTLLAVGVLMDKGAPYKNVICLGHLLDKDGKKMSKSIGNIVEPFEQMNKFGVDAVRWWMYSVNAPGESKNYDEKSVAEINNKVFNLFNNVLSFYELYRDVAIETTQGESTHVLDQWIMTRLSQTVAESTTALDAYDLFKPTRTIRDFIDDLSTWYLRRSRDRIKDGDVDAKRTLYMVMKTTAKLMAPFAPFFAEYVWQKLKSEKDEESIHLSVWPTADMVVDMTVVTMSVVRDLCTQGNALRKKLGISVKQPLQSITFKDTDLEEQYKELIKDELNVKEVLSGSDDTHFDIEITPELKQEGIARELMRAIQDTRKQKGLMPEDSIELVIGTSEEGRDVVQKFEADIKKTVGAASIKIVENESVEVTIETIPFSISF